MNKSELSKEDGLESLPLVDRSQKRRMEKQRV